MTGTLRIQGTGVDLQYIAVGDVVISGMCPFPGDSLCFPCSETDTDDLGGVTDDR